MPLSDPELLTAAHDVASFACGKPALDDWLRMHALKNNERGFTVVMVVHESQRVVGYYGIAPTAVIPTSLPRSIRTGQSPTPVPCLLLGQLAVDRNHARRGIGSGLVRHALIRCVAGARLIGGRALIVKAIDDEAAQFWKRLDFIPSMDDPLTLLRSLPDIAAALRDAGVTPEAP